MPARPKLFIAGAGNIGRGLLTALAMDAGWQITLLEANLSFAQRLRQAGGYHLTQTGVDEPNMQWVSGYDIVTPDQTHALETAIGEADLCATAVGGANLARLALLLAPALMRRTTALPIILCENMHGAAEHMQAALTAAGIPTEAFTCQRASVESMVVAAAVDSLDLIAEGGQALFVDATGWPGPLPALPGVEFTRQINHYYDRKLFTNNAGHALLAYRGALCGCTLLADALEIPSIQMDLCDLLRLSSQMLAAEHSVPLHELEAHVSDLLRRRYANRALGDTIRRVARQPLRKLGPEERLVGLARRLQRHQLPTASVARTIAAALLYFDAEDAEAVRLRLLLEDQGAGHILETCCGMAPAEPLYGECLAAYAQLAGSAPALPNR